MTPFISVIVPVYNMEKLVGRCLRSIVSQSFKDIELLVIDDGSTDGSGEVIGQFVATDPRVRCFSELNSGVSAARNLGLNNAEGEYIMFIDADDEIAPGYLQNISFQAKDSGVDLLVWGITRCFSDGRSEQWAPLKDGTYNRTDFFKAFPAEQYGKHEGLFGFVPNKLIKKDIVDRFGIRFDTTLNIMEDYDFFLDCYAHSHSVLCFGETGYRYKIYDRLDKPAGFRVVSYPQLIGVQNKCVEILKKEGAWTTQNEILLFNAIGNLSLSMFLETKKPVWTQTKSDLDFIWESPYCIPAIKAIDTRWKLLKHLILTRNVTGAFVFSRLWRSYFYLRTRGAA